MSTPIFAKAIHRSGATQYVAASETHTFTAWQTPAGKGSAHNGEWELRVRLDGHLLSVAILLPTLTEAKSVAARFAATIGSKRHGKTGEIIHAELVSAVAFVRRPADELDVDPVDLDVDAPEPIAAPVVVIACGAKKLDRRAPAAELYTSANFRLHLRAAGALAADLGGRVLILSALHGLVDPAAELEPYNVKMGDAGSIAADVLANQLEAIAPSSIHALLPRAYASALDVAAELAGFGDLVDLFADAPGIGYQRAVSATLLRSIAA